MAFTGTASVVSLGKNMTRITGISLAGGASGTIKKSGGDVNLPSAHPAISDNTIVHLIRASAGAVATAPITIAKSGTPTDTITLTNTDAANASGGFEIFVEEPHSLIK